MVYSIETHDLMKIYPQPRNFFQLFKKNEQKPVPALDGVNLQIKKGELFGVLGPNGAGKTTLTKILCTLILPTKGNVRVNGYDAVKDGAVVRSTIGLVSSDERSFYWKLSGRENLEFFAALNNFKWNAAKKRAVEVLEIVGLNDSADRRFETYSSGMKQKMAIARGLLNDPEILFLDEPTRSLDPNAAKEIRLFISNLSKLGKTIFLTTHNLHEAELLCNRVAILHKGRVRGLGSVKDLEKMLKRGEKITIIVKDFNQSKISSLKKLSDVENLKVSKISNNSYRIDIEIIEGATSKILEEMINLGCKIKSANTHELSLEQIFEKLTIEEGSHVK